MKAIVRSFVVAALIILADRCWAQAVAYPMHPVRLIVPFGAGGPTDVIARVVAQKLSERLGQQFYVENLPGAGGNIGAAQAARAPADGYTILVVSTGFIINPSLYAKGVPYDVKDFAPVTLVAASPNVITVNPAVPAHSVQELIGLIRANPGKYSFAQPSNGSTPHLAGEMFKLSFALDLVAVPFNSAASAINSTIGGHTPIAFTALPPAISNIKDGRLRALAVLSLRHAAALPDAPTAAEAGIPGHESDTLTGIVVPARTPKEIIEQIHNEVKRLLALAEVKEKLDTLGFDPVGSTPAEFGERIKSESVKWSKIINQANINIE